MTILITGITGELGSKLKHFFPDSISPTHEDLDICDSSSVKNIFETTKIDTVIHTAAFTSVRGCEENKIQAFKANVEGTKNLVNELKNFNDNYLIKSYIYEIHNAFRA